jgi:hypothetical protein
MQRHLARREGMRRRRRKRRCWGWRQGLQGVPVVQAQLEMAWAAVQARALLRQWVLESISLPLLSLQAPHLQHLLQSGVQ